MAQEGKRTLRDLSDKWGTERQLKPWSNPSGRVLGLREPRQFPAGAGG